MNIPHFSPTSAAAGHEMIYQLTDAINTKKAAYTQSMQDLKQVLTRALAATPAPAASPNPILEKVQDQYKKVVEQALVNLQRQYDLATKILGRMHPACLGDAVNPIHILSVLQESNECLIPLLKEKLALDEQMAVKGGQIQHLLHPNASLATH